MRLYQFVVPEGLEPDDGSQGPNHVIVVRKHLVSDLLEVSADEGFLFERLAGVSIMGDAIFLIMDENELDEPPRPTMFQFRR